MADVYEGVDTFSIGPLGAMRAGRGRLPIGVDRASETGAWRASRGADSGAGRIHTELPGIIGKYNPAQSARRCRIRGILIMVSKAEGDMLSLQFNVSSTVKRGQKT